MSIGFMGTGGGAVEAPGGIAVAGIGSDAAGEEASCIGVAIVDEDADISVIGGAIDVEDAGDMLDSIIIVD